MAELIVNCASKPVRVPHTIYDISYEFNITPDHRPMPMPVYAVDNVDLLSNPTMVIRTTSTTITNRMFYTDWISSAVIFDVDDWTNPRSTWRLKYGDNTYWSATYGLLPSSYSATNYELVSVDRLYISGNHRGNLLFQSNNGIYESAGSCVALSTSGSRSSISYEVQVRKKSTGDVITVTGTNASYTVSNSPYTGNTMALYVPETYFTTNGDMKGQVTMTETPN